MSSRRASCSLAVAGLLMVLPTSSLSAAEPEDSVDWPTVISQLRQQMYQRPGHAETRQQLATAYNNYGVRLGQQAEWEQAIEQLNQAIRLDPANDQFRKNLSSVYLNQATQAYQRHDITHALSAVEQSLALTPDLAQAYALRGQIEYDRQKLKEAKAAWAKALELDPTQTELGDRLNQVTEELPVESKFERISQAYFDVRYEEQLQGPVGFDIREALQEARRVVGSDFAYWPRHKIVVLVYSAESFHRLREETPDWVAGQFDGKIRVPLPSTAMDLATVKQVLFHEYTHAVIFDLTSGKCPVWLNEGLAEYEGRTQAPGSLKRLRKAYDTSSVIPWQELSSRFSTGLSAEDVARAYEEAYSIAAYLIDKYSFWRMRHILKALASGQPWETALSQEFHLQLPRLEANWRAWLPDLFSQGP